MKNIYIIFLAFTTASALADLPMGDDFISNDFNVVNNLLAVSHRELVNENCIFTAIESKQAKILMAQGYGIDSVRLYRIFDNYKQKHMIRTDFWGTNRTGDRTEVASQWCVLK